MGTAGFCGENQESLQTVIPLLDLLFPRRCAVCGRTLETEEQYLCEGCLKDMPLTYFWNWRENPAEKILWGRCHFETVSSLFYYHRESAYSGLTPKIKYGGDRALGLYLGKMLGHRLSGNIPDVDYIVPVPLHPLKKWRRGYNQAEIIAAGVMGGMREKSLPCGAVLSTDILVRKKWSRSQTTTDVGNKWENVSGAFALKDSKAEKYEGRHILLIDDVLTTGATAEACWNVLCPINDIRISYATLAFVE